MTRARGVRLYLAGPSRERARVLDAAAVLTSAGFVLTSRWHASEVPPSDAKIDRWVAVDAWLRNSDEIDESDFVVALANTGGGLSQGVREEVSYALGVATHRVDWPLRVVIVGDPGPSLAVTGCVVVETVGQAVEMLRGGA